jgi:hypothetical protein
MSNVDDIESHIQLVEKARGTTFLEVADLPASERDHMMGELALMGITAASLLRGPGSAYSEVILRIAEDAGADWWPASRRDPACVRGDGSPRWWIR